MSSQNLVYKTKDLQKSFLVGHQAIPVVRGISIEINLGDFAVIVGPSGCGKSTLLHMLLGLEMPSAGYVNFLDQDLYANSTEDSRSDFRKTNVGMIYQQPNWIKSLTVAENVAFPLLLMGEEKTSALRQATEMLDTIKLLEWSKYFPSELSGGQQQRAALARALVHKPKVIIADEPTGNLDFAAGQDVMLLLQSLNKDKGITVIMVTHDLEYVTYASRVIQMLDGQVVGNYAGDEIENFIKKLRLKR